MKASLNRGAVLAAMGAVMLFAAQAQAITTVNTFNNFTSDALYASWQAPGAVTSGPTSYDITATGYGSNYKYIGFPVIAGAGNTKIQLTVNLIGPPAADGQLGPIIDIEDGDGTAFKYAWYGQLLGSHVLTRPLTSPDGVNAAGTTPGLDLSNLTQMHMELDPGAFGVSGAYTVQWQDLSLIVPEPGSLALAACSCGLLLRLRRRSRA